MLKQIIPLTENARRFVEQFGDTFAILSSKVIGKCVTLQGFPTGQIVKVEKKGTAIFVNGSLFCKEW